MEILSKKPFADKNDYVHFDSYVFLLMDNCLAPTLMICSCRFHGFAAARANLDDPDNKAKYEELYRTLIKFVKKVSA